MSTIPASDHDGDLSGEFDALFAYWAKARIDDPKDVAQRHDDAAKQLIAVGGVLQAGYLAVFAFAKDRAALWLLLPVLVPLLSVIFCSARVLCQVQSRINAYDTFHLLTGRRDYSHMQRVDAALKKWCEGIEDLAERKRLWLHYANVSFFWCSLLTVLLVFVIVVLQAIGSPSPTIQRAGHSQAPQRPNSPVVLSRGLAQPGASRLSKR